MKLTEECSFINLWTLELSSSSFLASSAFLFQWFITWKLLMLRFSIFPKKKIAKLIRESVVKRPSDNFEISFVYIHVFFKYQVH